jgi:hypothetical protein
MPASGAGDGGRYTAGQTSIGDDEHEYDFYDNDEESLSIDVADTVDHLRAE